MKVYTNKKKTPSVHYLIRLQNIASRVPERSLSFCLHLRNSNRDLLVYQNRLVVHLKSHNTLSPLIKPIQCKQRGRSLCTDGRYMMRPALPVAKGEVAQTAFARNVALVTHGFESPRGIMRGAPVG